MGHLRYLWRNVETAVLEMTEEPCYHRLPVWKRDLSTGYSIMLGLVVSFGFDLGV